MAQVRKLNESNSRRYQFCDKRIKNLLRKIHADKDKVEKNQGEVSQGLGKNPNPCVAVSNV